MPPIAQVRLEPAVAAVVRQHAKQNKRSLQGESNHALAAYYRPFFSLGQSDAPEAVASASSKSPIDRKRAEHLTRKLHAHHMKDARG